MNERGKVNLIVIIGIVFFQLVLSFLLVWLFVLPKINNSGGDDDEEQSKKKAKKEKEVQYVILQDPDFANIVVNPSDGNGRILQLSITFEYDMSFEALPAEIDNRQPEILDSINMLLSSTSINDLSRPDYRDQLKEQIKQLMNGLLKDTEMQINRVFFPQFIIP